MENNHTKAFFSDAIHNIIIVIQRCW